MFLRFLIPLMWATCVFLASAGSSSIRVACIGDSITEGAGVGNTRKYAYPSKLGQLLGRDYQVRNFGRSGTTLLKNGDFPYIKEGPLGQSLSFEAHVVVIKLGTNDAKPQNWRFAGEFVGDYEELIDRYLAATPSPRILLVTPCPVYRDGAFGINPNVVANEIVPAVRDLAARRGLELVDMHRRMAGFPEWLPDTVHPNELGTSVMAALVYSGITAFDPNRARPSLVIDPTTPGNPTRQCRWPSFDGGFVLQRRSALGGGEEPWEVVGEPAVDDGDWQKVRLFERASSRFYRLWRP